ncbi:hypothetical protein SISSUDRAFT_1051952 [Sistotremastrum suecicum HHB10207 ss-3]|uniref:Uncharacterized protein n=1 Tax=Sistotremastrum suecicum HHB10207 ss-3 TaxID=1314776 RepID=A0A166A8A5_9AGAM|nr:hypothetical protein SISSUDRAFT_1051952 [Sistotremastrum suecicum HHB10207 ss-3]
MAPSGNGFRSEQIRKTRNPAAILTSVAPDVTSTTQDKLLHQLLCEIEKEAYRLAPQDGSKGFAEADQYVLDMQDKMSKSMEVLRASVNRAFNRRILIARLPNEVLAVIFEHCVVAWEEQQQGRSYERDPSADWFNWFPLVYVCQTWRRVALNTPALFTFLNLSWPSRIIDLFLQCGGTSLPLTLVAPFELSYIPLEYNGLEMKDKTHFLQTLMVRARDLTLSVGSSLFSERATGLNARAPILRTLKINYISGGLSFDTASPSGLRTLIFDEPPPLLEHLDLFFGHFTEDWTACTAIKSVCLQYDIYTSSSLPRSSVLDSLSKLPSLEQLEIMGWEWSPGTLPVETVAFNALHTLTLSSMRIDNVSGFCAAMDLPALKHFTTHAICCTGYIPDPWPQPNPHTAWEYPWLDRLCKSASVVQIILGGNHGALFDRRAIAEIRMLRSQNDPTPVLHATFSGEWNSEPTEDMGADEYVPVFETLTHRFPHRASSIQITGLGAMKTLPPLETLNSFFARCQDLTSLALRNCVADGVIASLRAINREVLSSAPPIQELSLPGCQVNAEDLVHLAQESKTAGRPIKTIDLRETTLSPLHFDVGMLGHEFKL